jgi:hypothetical protein
LSNVIEIVFAYSESETERERITNRKWRQDHASLRDSFAESLLELEKTINTKVSSSRTNWILINQILQMVVQEQMVSV